MVDREKVIKGFECCKVHGAVATGELGIYCGDECQTECPYSEKNDSPCYCLENLVADAIALLKAQEPRVMTLEEMREGEVYWFDCPGNFVLRPVLCNMYDRGDSSYLNFVWLYGNFSWKICEYGRTWRCWTSRLTDEQRRGTPWD